MSKMQTTLNATVAALLLGFWSVPAFAITRPAPIQAPNCYLNYIQCGSNCSTQDNNCIAAGNPWDYCSEQAQLCNATCQATYQQYCATGTTAALRNDRLIVIRFTLSGDCYYYNLVALTVCCGTCRCHIVRRAAVRTRGSGIAIVLLGVLSCV